MFQTYRNRQPRHWTRLLTLLALLLPLAGKAQFGTNNAVVVRIGNGTTSLSGSAAPVSLLEYSSTGGTPVSTLNLNSGSTGTRLTLTGNSTTEGALYRTPDGQQLTIAGYDVAAGATSVTGSSIPRTLATIDVSRTATVQTAPSTLGSTGNHRSVAAVGTGFYSGTSSGGVQYYDNPSASTNSAVQLSSAPTNIRVVGVYGGQLYATSMSGSNVGLNTIGTGTPTTSGQTTTLIIQPGGTASTSLYGFVLLDQSATESGFDVAYLADDRGSAGGGIYKYSKVAGTWTFNGLIGSTLGTRYVAARLTGTGVELYVATTGALYTFSDNSGYNTAPTVTFPSASIATAGTNYAFRGVAFAPSANPVPTITSLAPSSATAGDPAQTLTVNGTNFITSSVVNFNGTARTTTYVSATQLTIQLTAADLATAGSYDVTVTNPTPGGGTTAPATFTVNPVPATNPVPTITSLSPSSVIAGAAAQTLTVNGTNFIASSVVNFSSTARTTTYVSATQLTIQLTAADQATAGNYDVTVTNPAPGGGTSAPSTFTVNPVPNNPVPTITSLAPSSVIVGAAAQTLTVNGTNFLASSVVNFNGAARTTTYVSATQLTIQLTAADQATAGNYDVTVTNPAPGGGTSAPATFTVNPVPAPTLTSINPTTITAGTATTVTFTGTNFVNGATVNFNGAVLNTTFVSSTTVRASITAPTQSATVTYQVSVTTPSGTTTTRTLTATGVFVLVPISISAVNTAVTENFNTLASSGTDDKISLPPGIDFVETDANADDTYTAGTGSSTSGDTYSFGSAGSTDRALGSLLTGNLVSRFGAQYVNNTGQTITSLLIGYNGEQWRLGSQNRLDRLDFQYSLNATSANAGTFVDFDALDFVTPNTVTTGAKDGNLAANRTALSAVITGLSIAPGATFFIRWVDADAANADDGLAVDDLSVTANPPQVACAAPSAPTFSNITPNSADVTVAAGANGTGPFTVTATPTAGGTAIVATGTSPVSLTGLAAGTSYSVTVTSNCNTGYSSPSQASTAVTLTTSAAPAPTLAVTQGATSYPSGGTAYSFGNRTLATTSAPVTFTLTNSGNSALTINNISTTGDFAVSGTAPTTIAAGGTATVSVTFTPTALNTRTGTLVINSDATNGAAYTVNLTGSGSAVPVPLINVVQGTTPYANGSTFSGFAPTTVGNFSNVTFTIQNTGTGPLTITGLAPGGTDFSTSFGPGGPTLPFDIAVGSSATFLVIFGPTAPGTRTGSVTISSNSALDGSYVINLSGQGTAATLPDLTVTTGTPTAPTPISGNYNNVTIAPGGNAIVAGALTVAGTLTVQPNGLLIQNCQSITGTGSFVLQAGGALAICDQAGIYTTGALGAIRVSGSRTYSPGAAYIYNGTVAQVTGPGLPAQVAALGVTNAAGVTLSQALSVAQQVTLQLGNLNTGGQTFTLLSSASGTAVLDNGTAGSVVNGTATVQRYIDNANPIGYRQYSAPVSNTTVNDLATSNFTPVFNTAYNTSPTPSTIPNFPNVFGYDEARVGTVTSTYGPFDKGWYVPASGSPMQVNRGYTVNAPNTAIVDFVGLLNNGSQNSGALGFTSANGGWQFLGNPYPAPLDWSTVVAGQRPGMEGAMYVFQSSGQYGGSYRSYTNGIGGASPLVPTAAGYFVRVATQGSTGSVNLTNANRVTTFGLQPAFGRGAADTRPQLQLQLNGATAGLDEAYIYFEAGATTATDAEYDARKLANPSGLSLASLAGGVELSINGLPALTNATVLVPLTVQVPQAGSYRLQVGELVNFTGTATLIDALSGTRTVLSTGTSYAFALTGTAAPGRFSVEFRSTNALATTPAQALAAQVQLFPNPASGSFRLQLPVLRSKAAVSATLVNALGQTVLTRALSAPAGQAIDAAFDVHGLAAGVYTLRLNVDGTPLVRKVVVE
ncbi:IPT/TIG domain-containing protein [Hymenobacter properus]|uniref:IPT/TIG domain-containing protein n=1 Tax=Hymenobacter properus TaxID=2791026 RepID=A0A931BIW5_9BACT|nr:IPT/TIG domain-containing protein [Hymenobacter properus]MBF9143331.1 IPT/TIG domain-containing protein [Hymenobacter properus]MBR7722141.1 IPT/TIG domain-containing protein [Microvirga sp. SRT04]